MTAPSPAFDPAAATAAYMATLSPAAHAKATAYTQGGHWVLLWSAVVSLAVCWIVLRSGVLVRTATAVERRRPRRNLAVFACSVVFSLLSFVIGLPWSAYSGWWREKGYGLTSQAFGGWFGEQLLELALSSVVLGLFLVALYALMRRAGRAWWAWGAGLAAVFVVLGTVVAPIAIEPLFNRYTPAPPSPTRDAVVALAKATGTPSDKIFVYDGSRQSNRYTANVSGLGGSARVAMSDVMFKKGADIAEVRGVVGHEMGHYKRLHVLWGALFASLMAALSFFLIDRLFAPASRLMGAHHVAAVSDPAGLPVLVALLTVITLLATPLTNTATRLQEADADRFSFDHAHEPDGLSKALVKTIEYRASSPSDWGGGRLLRPPQRAAPSARRHGMEGRASGPGRALNAPDPGRCSGAAGERARPRHMFG